MRDRTLVEKVPPILRIVLSFAVGVSVLSAAGCGGSNDLAIYKSKDGNLELRFFKDSILMDIHEDGVHRMGIKGILISDGERTDILVGLECGDTGGEYIELSVHKDDEPEMVGFSDRYHWQKGGAALIDNVASELCQIGERRLADETKPTKS